MRVEDLQPNVAVRGILPEALVTIVSVQWYGDNALKLMYTDPAPVAALTALSARLPAAVTGAVIRCLTVDPARQLAHLTRAERRSLSAALST